MPTVLKLILSVFVTLVSTSNGYIFDEAGSVSLIESIDRYHRSTDDQFDQDVSFFDEHGHTGHEEEDPTGASRFTNEWVVKITGGSAAAAKLAEEMGYEIIGEVISVLFLQLKHILFSKFI